MCCSELIIDLLRDRPVDALTVRRGEARGIVPPCGRHAVAARQQQRNEDFTVLYARGWV